MKKNQRNQGETTPDSCTGGAPGHAASADLARSLETRGRVLFDLGSQNLISLVLYPVLWLVLMLHADLARRDPLFFWANLVVLILSTVLRYRVHLRMRECAYSDAPVVERMLVGAVLLNAAHWAVMTVWALVDPALHSIRIAMLLVGTGMIGSGTFAVVFNTTLRVMFPAILAVPAGITLLLSENPDERVWGALCLVFLAYILAAGRKRQQDYYKAVGTAMLLEQRTKELEQISFTDAVTGLRNRSYFDAHFELEWRRAHRQQYPLSLLMIDVDHFKAINDRFGHPAGDRCLAALGLCIARARRRAGDILARFGGDEFVILLANADEPAAERIAAALGHEVRRLAVHEQGEPIPLTISVGVATMIPSDPAHARELLALADAALYEAKQSGRNQWKRAA
ncbi:MAG TPA: GGDEF domain-containing protein [Noviherbaspirillum sp.]|uniref:GGDEF domain-containing protein n=1 Tax=Noviherbaspirillum sp. TaxID=1926288 RepID=UPI002D412991|nr:GGDEF domain-containing protein [Noviherbaspirillum sp.]HYD93858.1 GGDEF domain-containing protein [Noviherbaspirillum sp.]